MDTLKSKPPAKLVIPRSSYLEDKILGTMHTIAEIVGGTLGPGGRPVLIERQEFALAPQISKDGVTVFRSLGFQDAISQCVLETARDASVKTAESAGDGTTSASILSEAFVKYTATFCKNNPSIPPIRVIKTIQNLLQEKINPAIDRLTVPCDFTTEEGKDRLLKVAKLSGNGDVELAEAVMRCFEITGDTGNVTITEASGNTSYEVEKIDGYPISSGVEESCSRFYSAFINDAATQRAILEKPAFILYFGRLNSFSDCYDLIAKIQEAWAEHYLSTPNVVLFAAGFSESVLANLASIFSSASNINVLPVVIPKTAIINSERHMLDDIAAVCGAEIFDPITNPLSNANIEDLGNLGEEIQHVNGLDVKIYVPLGVKVFESGRYRSTIIGHCAEEILLKRVSEVEAAVPNAESELDLRYLQERLAKLTGGIARLKVAGSSGGETKERRDRAEDAVCATRGAIKFGSTVGGGWTLLRLATELQDYESDEITKKIINEIVNPALLAPIHVLFKNAGLDETAQDSKVAKSVLAGNPEKAFVTNIATGECVNALDAGILDSTPALRDALKNSISIATLLGTLGGVICWPRDRELEIKDARDSAEFSRMIQSNMADDRP